jgi:hypothetical protein
VICFFAPVSAATFHASAQPAPIGEDQTTLLELFEPGHPA